MNAKKRFLSLSAGALLISALAVPARALQQEQQPPQQSEPKRHNEKSKSTSGKVTNIAKDEKSFTVQQSQGDKGTIVFIVDSNTQINGEVGVGTEVVVEFQPSEDGQNIALVVSSSRSGNGQ